LALLLAALRAALRLPQLRTGQPRSARAPLARFLGDRQGLRPPEWDGWLAIRLGCLPGWADLSDNSKVGTSVWVPLVTAAIGLIAGFGTSIITQRRADSREDARWKREDSQRWLRDRQQAYAQLMAALYAWDDELRRARADRNVGALLNERSELDTAELRRLRMAAREARALVDLMASEPVRSLAKSAQTEREIFGTIHLEGEESMDPAKTEAAWTRVRDGTVALREAMRTGLGLQGMVDDHKQQAGR
jgi:hypothetical protein